MAEKDKGGRRIAIDLRPEVLALDIEDGALWLHLRKGSPALLAAHLLGCEAGRARSLEIRKTAVRLA
jgi:hypothetical protein